MDDFQIQRQKDMCKDCIFCDEKAIGKVHVALMPAN